MLASFGVLAGCSAPSPGVRQAADWKSPDFKEPSAKEEEAPPVSTTSAPALTVPAAPTLTERTADLVISNQFTETWVPVRRWCKATGMAEPSWLVSLSRPTFELRSTNGNFVFRPGVQVAEWDGVEVHLGFGPQLIDRQPYLHHLDLTKTVIPLLSGARLHCTGSPPVVVLDPGHGGQDAGAGSALSRCWEKQFTLDWALRLQHLLATNGWQVYLTRTDDREMPLSNRVAFAEERKADLFVSLHFNSAGENLEQAGLETYCLTPEGMPSALTRGYGDDPGRSFPNNAFDAQNLQLAFRVHRNLLAVNGHVDRGVRRARFLGVLRNQQRPAILIEGGYLSNKREARLISEPAYRQKLAEAVARGLLE